MENFYSKSVSESLTELKSSEQGLSTEEAQKRLAVYGENKLPEKKNSSFIVKFFKQFANVMILILLVSAIISLVIAIKENNKADLIDPFIIFGIVILNSLLGAIQESKAENALSALKKMSEPYAKVIRNGKEEKVKTAELVCGDIVVLEAGDIIPADLRLISSANLECLEASLTGESLPSKKDENASLKDKTPLGDRKNMCYSSCVVSNGRGLGLVVATGVSTEIGKIASMLAEAKEEKSPLEKNLDKLGKVLTVAVLAISVVIFLVNEFISKQPFIESFMTAVSLAVAAIPESLPAVVTIILSLGVTKLSKKNVIVRKLHIVESLGCCNYICSDKTGTITQNKMTVKKLYFNGEIVDAEKLNKDEETANDLISCMILCNDARTQDGKVLGDPTETALISLAENLGISTSEFVKNHTRKNEISFDSNRKLMSTLNNFDEKYIMWTKGATDGLLQKCSHILKNGKVEPITDQDKEEILKANTELCSKALRVLGYAMKKYDESDPTKIKLSEDDLTFIGLTGMIDPPRPEVFEALKKCHKAGMKAVMITGDHKDTAYAIASELKMVKSKDEVVDGAYLDNFTDEELVKEIKKYTVFTRVSPEHKVRIVKALKASGNIVAMTGDGVNDAPSIKSADVGIGMGITGTDVTKEVSDLILTDDNFATIIVAVEEGRKIFANIKKTIQFLLSCNIAEILTIFMLTILFKDSILFTPIQILFINLVTDTLPAIALGVEPSERNIMDEKPRKDNHSLFTKDYLSQILVNGFAQFVLVTSAYLIGFYAYESHELASTMSFLVLCGIQLAHMFNSSLNSSIFSKHKINNVIIIAFSICLALLLAIALIPPVMPIFSVEKMTLAQWAIVVGLSLMIIPFVEIYKLIVRLKNKKTEKVSE